MNKSKQTKSLKTKSRQHFSSAVMEIAKNNLKKFESQSDEAFLTRAKMDRKLSSL